MRRRGRNELKINSLWNFPIKVNYVKILQDILYRKLDYPFTNSNTNCDNLESLYYHYQNAMNI